MLQPNRQRIEKEAKYKLLYKKSGCTMPLFENLLYHQAIHRKKALSQMYRDWKGKFIITV